MVALGQESTRLGSMDLNLFSSNQGTRYLSTFYIVAVETGNLLPFHSNQNQYILFVVAPSTTSPFGNVTLSSGKFGYNNNNHYNA
jgi:hypothetical protein